jgi:hypothetical protein
MLRCNKLERIIAMLEVKAIREDEEYDSEEGGNGQENQKEEESDSE